MASGSATEEQCSCLSDYVHKHFSDNEVNMIMRQQLGDNVFAAKVEDVVQRGSQACIND